MENWEWTMLLFRTQCDRWLMCCDWALLCNLHPSCFWCDFCAPCRKSGRCNVKSSFCRVFNIHTLFSISAAKETPKFCPFSWNTCPGLVSCRIFVCVKVVIVRVMMFIMPVWQPAIVRIDWFRELWNVANIYVYVWCNVDIYLTLKRTSDSLSCFQI